jgi:hypothetical protein
LGNVSSLRAGRAAFPDPSSVSPLKSLFSVFFPIFAPLHQNLFVFIETGLIYQENSVDKNSDAGGEIGRLKNNSCSRMI